MGGQVGSFSSSFLMNGSFHRQLFPAAGEMLLPFNSKIREMVAGKLELGSGLRGSGSVCEGDIVVEVGTAAYAWSWGAGVEQLLGDSSVPAPIAAVWSVTLSLRQQFGSEIPL